MTYTPGPWDIHEANDRNDAFYITHKNRRGIGSISNSFFETDSRDWRTVLKVYVVNNGLVTACQCNGDDDVATAESRSRCSRWNDHIKDGDQYTSAEDAANARLIAASPDLILALKEWISMAVNSGLEGCDEILEQAEAAIDKATKEIN